ncbi:TPM domain-containing protein [Flavobacterium suzhouense]|uniref:TPM domain-containing protein n=1 Tax=Flavobacterium suzhouense TaxID=1529638 RepID=A0ABW5NY05_9FLAO
MKKAYLLLVSILFIQSAFAQDVLDKFPIPIVSVNDFENIFTDEEEAILNGLMFAYNEQADTVIVVITIDEKSTTAEQFDNLTLQIANKWKIGSAKKNNGILIGISKGLRRIRIQSGIGIEIRLADEETKQIIDTVFIPKFKEGHYYKGTRDGIKAIVDHLKKNN